MLHLWFILLTVFCQVGAEALDVAFVLVPASPMGAMLPVAAGALKAA